MEIFWNWLSNGNFFSKNPKHDDCSFTKTYCHQQISNNNNDEVETREEKVSVETFSPLVSTISTNFTLFGDHITFFGCVFQFHWNIIFAGKLFYYSAPEVVFFFNFNINMLLLVLKSIKLQNLRNCIPFFKSNHL